MSKRLSESRIIQEVADRASRRITHKVVATLQRMHDTLSGDCSGLTTTWDEICVQVQYLESFHWDVYDEVVKSLVASYVAELPSHERDAIWMQTEEGIDWEIEEPEERNAHPVVDNDIVRYLTHEYVYAKAGRW